MKTVIQLCVLLRMPFFSMKFGKINILLQLFHLLIGNLCRCQISTQTFQFGTDHINILYVFYRNAGNIGAFIGYNLNQTFQF